MYSAVVTFSIMMKKTEMAVHENSVKSIHASLILPATPPQRDGINANVHLTCSTPWEILLNNRDRHGIFSVASLLNAGITTTVLPLNVTIAMTKDGKMMMHSGRMS
jgi:hypothetical protein